MIFLSLLTHFLRYAIGPKGKYTPVQAYLQIDEIINIAKTHNVNMIHPGYGFLSENSVFAKKVVENGMVWIGPPAEVIDAVGDKVCARNLANKCDVPVVPGTPGPIESFRGGRGFRQEVRLPCHHQGCFWWWWPWYACCQREAKISRMLSTVPPRRQRRHSATALFSLSVSSTEPKHIEVQILADNEGNVVHLFERDCSVQRRHQKVVEVAPALDLPVEVRDAILSDAVKLAQTANYRNAGTAEFLVDNQNRHYFIESTYVFRLSTLLLRKLLVLILLPLRFRLLLALP